MKLKWFEKKVDERQEMDLLKVEHFGFWMMYWMLLAALIIQGIFMEDGVKRAAGEWIIFMPYNQYSHYKLRYKWAD